MGKKRGVYWEYTKTEKMPDIMIKQGTYVLIQVRSLGVEHEFMRRKAICERKYSKHLQ